MSRPESIAAHGNPPRRVGLEGYVISDWILGLRNAATSLTAGLDVEMPYRMIRAQYLADLGPRAVEALLKVPPEVQEVHLVSRLGRLELGAQPGEIAAAVHQRPDQVPGGEGPEVGGQVGPVPLAEEPQPDSRIVGHVIGSILLKRGIRRAGRVWKHVRIVAPSDRPHPPMLIVNGRHDEQVPMDDMIVLLEHGQPKEARFFPGGHMGYGPDTLPTVIAWLQRTAGTVGARSRG